MSRRAPVPITLRDFQQEAVERLSAAALETARMIAQAPSSRRAIARRIGCSLLEAPTGSGKTIVLAATAEAISQHAPVVWFWFAPFAGLVAQTASALRAAAPALRVRDPARDRGDIGTRAGDVFITTWASVAARSAETRRMRVDDDTAPALDTLVTQLRAAGFRLGAVVDEAHHSFKPGSQSFRFFDHVLDPDLLMAATATPDDADIEMLRRALDVARFQHVSVSRARVVAARLNKPRVRVVSFVAHGTSRELLDLNETALRKAVDQHRALKAELHRIGLPIVPLLLVQAASTAWTPARVRDLLRGPLQFPDGAVATHTADEPDPDVQALANDPKVEVLVFKMAIATGFDAPRAFTLCALRPVVDAGFGLQVVGRIMRVHPLLQTRAGLPPALDTGWVFLGDAQGQAGLQSAADRIKAIRDSIEVATDGVAVYEAAVGEGGQITVTDAAGQSMLLLEPPPAPAFGGDFATGAGPAEGMPAQSLRIPETLFGRLEETQAAAPTPDAAASAAVPRRTPAAQAMAHSYRRRTGLPVPRCLRTERMPRDVKGLLDALIRNVRFGPEHFTTASRVGVSVERREADLFDPTQQRRMMEQSAISDLFASATAHERLRVSQYLNPADIGRRLQAALTDALHADGQSVPSERTLRRALNLVLVQFPNLLPDAMRRAMAACAEVEDAAELPEVWGSPEPLTDSLRNLYGVMPAGLNRWEQRFADQLDAWPGVLWWTRNLPRPNAADDWSVRIVLPETGRGYYPDFVVCIDGRRRRDGIALAETKERIESEASAAKSRSEHREYGRALMLSYDIPTDRFIRVEFAPDLGRNKEVRPLRFEDFIAD